MKRYTNKKKGANDKTVTVWSDHNVLEKANRALNLANQMYRYINVEVKHHDTIQSATAIPLTGNIIGLSAIPQGDALTNRDGSSVKPLHLTWRAELANVTGATLGTIVRCVLFRGKQENGSGYVATDILENATVYSPKNYTDRFRTKVLWDETFTMNNPSTAQATKRFISKSEKLFQHITFSGSGTSIEDGGLYMLQISNQPTNVPAINSHFRLTFTDN